MSDVELALLISVIATVTWTAYLLLVGPRRRPTWAIVLWLVSFSFAVASTLAITGPVSVSLIGELVAELTVTLAATINRSLVAAFGIVCTLRVVVHRWEVRRRRAGSREA